MLMLSSDVHLRFLASKRKPLRKSKSSCKNYMIRVMAESLGSIATVDFENEQREIAKKRMQKVNERLLILQSMKSKLKVIKGTKAKMEHRKTA